MKLMLACNDPDNGTFTGSVDNIKLGNLDTRLMSLYGKSLAFAVDKDDKEVWIKVTDNEGVPVEAIPCKMLSLHLEKLSFRGLDYRRWVGNWCWDEVLVGTHSAARIANYLRAQGWDCEEAWSNLYDKWEAGTEFTRKDFQLADV